MNWIFKSKKIIRAKIYALSVNNILYMIYIKLYNAYKI